MSDQHDHDDWRWKRHAVMGVCEYCGDMDLVMDEPFGQKPACRTCWEKICYGE